MEEIIYVVYNDEKDVINAFNNKEDALKECVKYNFEYTPVSLYRENK